MKRIDKIALIAVLVIIVTNPASSQFILALLDEIFKEIFLYASPINFVASGVVLVYIGYKMWAGREKVVIPKKSTSKAGAYIKT